MSKRVIFVCSLLLLSGLLSAWEICSALLQNRISINLGVLLIPISIGLFLGNAAARSAAAVLFFLTYLLLAVIVVVTLVSGGSGVAQVFGASYFNVIPVMLVMVTIVGSIVGWFHWMLYTPPFNEHLK